jgi:hypothetical protein
LRWDGQFRYAYDAVGDTILTGNNDVRQLMAGRLLAQLAVEAPELRASHRRNLAYIDSAFVRHRSGGYAYAAFEGGSKLGAIAMALSTVVASPYFEQRRSLAAALARTIRSMLNEDGSFNAWYIAGQSDVPAERLLTFYSGEAVLALLEYGARADDTEAIRSAVLAQEHYLQKYVHEIDEHYYPAYVPWHTQTLYWLFSLTCEPRYARGAFALNDRLLQIQDTVGVVGRFFNRDFFDFGPPHAASDAVYTEGFVYALELAHAAEDTIRVAKYARALELAVDNLISLQISPSDVQHGGYSAASVGLLRTRVASPLTRIDNTQHAIDAFRKILGLGGAVAVAPGCR